VIQSEAARIRREFEINRQIKKNVSEKRIRKGCGAINISSNQTPCNEARSGQLQAQGALELGLKGVRRDGVARRHRIILVD
jgi:hypothetical protein